MRVVVGIQTAVLEPRLRRLRHRSISQRHMALNRALGGVAEGGGPLEGANAVVVRLWVGDAVREGWSVARTRKDPRTVEYRLLASSLKNVPEAMEGPLLVVLCGHALRTLGLSDALSGEASAIVAAAAAELEPYTDQLQGLKLG